MLDKLGEGGRSTVYAAKWQGREVALKIYKPRAIRNHRVKYRQSIALYEFDRNRAFYEVAGLERYVAQPLAVVDTHDEVAMLQERLDGELYYFYYKRHDDHAPADFPEHLRRILELSHQAKLYDVDMHAMNIMVVAEADGTLVPKLFDFNLVPSHDNPRNPVIAVAMKLRLLNARSRDLRKLDRLHDFERYERALLHYYEPEDKQS